MFVFTPHVRCSLSHWRRSSFVPYLTSNQRINCPVLKPELSTAKSSSMLVSGHACERLCAQRDQLVEVRRQRFGLKVFKNAVVVRQVHQVAALFRLAEIGSHPEAL